MATRVVEPPVRSLVERAVATCAEGNYSHGLKLLEQAAGEVGEPRHLPPRALAAYGLALVSTGSGRTADGIGFCKAAVEKSYGTDPEVYLALARAYLAAGSRRNAVAALARGLRLDPQYPGLVRLGKVMGQRRPPILPFLPRSHFLNRLLGQLRHRLLGGAAR